MTPEDLEKKSIFGDFMGAFKRSSFVSTSPKGSISDCASSSIVVEDPKELDMYEIFPVAQEEIPEDAFGSTCVRRTSS